MKKAVALKYNEATDYAPRVIAKGQGELAERILTLAKSHDILTQENEALTSLLSKVELGDTIPKEAFKTVAEIIMYLYEQEGKRV